MNKLTGRCLCGSMTYEIDAEPLISAACHCTHCRRQTGSAYSTIAAFPEESVSIHGDTLETFEDIGESGLPVLRKFCKKCGSALFTDVKAFSGMLFIKTGTLDEPNKVSIGAEIWVQDKLESATLNPDLPKFEKNPPAD